jgi:pyruvate/2-oxoglutarate dehydrogenase complex dihydrolipoamide dehydrogenase (E3) component
MWSARVAHLAHHAGQFGIVAGPVETDMAAVLQRKREMVNREIELHLQKYRATHAELIMGSGRFVAPKVLEAHLNDGSTRLLAGERVFLNLGSHAAIPSIPGLEAARPLTHVEALGLDYLPPHLIVLGGGYVGLELAQAYRRFGSRVTVIEAGPRIMSREDPDVSDEVQRILGSGSIQFLLGAEILRVPLRRAGRDYPAHDRRRADDRRQRHPHCRGAHPEHRRRRPGAGRDRPGRTRLRPRQRAAGNECARCLGARRMRRQPAVHARLGR